MLDLLIILAFLCTPILAPTLLCITDICIEALAWAYHKVLRHNYHWGEIYFEEEE